MIYKLRNRKTQYPRTYFLLRKEGSFYLLFWLEHGNDDSLYIWFDDDVNNSWELVAKHSQKELMGTANIILNHKAFNIFDPHISWHPSGRIHVSGYDKAGDRGKHVISDRTTDSLYKMISGTTVPITQMLFPSLNAKNSLKYLGQDLSFLRNTSTWVTTLGKKGYHGLNNSAPGEGFFIIENSLIPYGHVLGFDISAYWKTNDANFTGKTSLELQKSMLFAKSFSINRGATGITACLRIFSLKFGDKPKNLRHIVATCFNRESKDLFQLKKIF